MRSGPSNALSGRPMSGRGRKSFGEPFDQSLRHLVPKLYLRCHSDFSLRVVLGARVWEALDGER
jgi:hypothetical protein